MACQAIVYDGGIANPTLNIGRTFLDGGLQIHRNVNPPERAKERAKLYISATTRQGRPVMPSKFMG